MVNFALPTLAALAVAQLTGATPVATQSGTTEVFSFSKWVDGIIANPNGDNLTPEEAVEAWHASVNETSAAATGENLIQKRYTCNTIPNTEAYVPDAVACINELARRGGQECRVDAVTVFCVIGRAQITGVRGGNTPTASSCNDVARGAGYVMDHCTRADNTVQGSEFAYGNGNLLVWIRRPS
ncbi:hypothetical protein CGRA01v4_04466 [Colletotrichum graminicola]|uniref:Ecp2 effector protein domain-containing protein n=1 Tax=Colletotrichum graminicola (strain M1.001 / M2 / FGSC 10212) TaxID=645133 RepID=E3Q8M6_COLGM|nr:uncharacterized protein GLRG_01885 [Colletotrichum graminicola M1.001]EFQ27390.1 hypothetical protein GLRG_01885 [Colletotrichum graminicola M1.001]WDK13185.1 hypothetical protein CGRA01v4_04466 [Colletotrichum graminicola]